MGHKSILIYDGNCPFCCSVAALLKRHYDILIIPNNKCRIKGIQADIKRDVHLIVYKNNAMTVYSGCDAAAKVLSMNHNWVWAVYSTQPFKTMASSIYWLVKKSRKYLLITNE